METTFTIPDGFELRQTGDNKFEIVPKTNIQQNINNYQQYVPNYRPQEPIVQMDYQQPGNCGNFIDQQRKDVIEERWNQLQCMDYSTGEQNQTDQLFSGNALHELYKAGKLNLSRDERQLLEFCHRTDMKKFLKEEVGDKPIRLAGDEEGNFWLADKYGE